MIEVITFVLILLAFVTAMRCLGAYLEHQAKQGKEVSWIGIVGPVLFAFMSLFTVVSILIAGRMTIQ